MNTPPFVEVREAVAQWLNRNQGKLEKNNILAEILKDNKSCLRVELNFGELLAEILVEEPDFAPYRYVSFQAVDIINGVPQMVYSWYDEEGNTIEEIIKNLDKAIDVVFGYNNRMS